jgi:ribosomal protein S18 acetylase RimI-like enzyme
VTVRSLGFRTDLVLRRLAGATVEPREGYLVVRTPQNPGFYWGNFLLVPAPPGAGDAERWLAQFEAEFPAARHVAIGVDGTDGELGAAESFVTAGLSASVSTVLTADRLEAPGAAFDAARLRPLDSDEDWEQAVRLRLDIDGPTDEAERTFVVRRAAEMRSLVEAGHGVYVGAFVDGVMRSGLGLFATGDGVGRYQTVETHPEFRRRGLARSLVTFAADLGRQSYGIERVVIVADPDDVAVRLYRRLGFTDLERQVEWQRAPG